MTENSDPENEDGEQQAFEDRIREQFEGVSDEEFLAEIRESYSEGNGLSVPHYFELCFREEEGLDVASHDSELAQAIADEKARVTKTMTELSKKFADIGRKVSEQFSKIQLPTFEVPPSLLEAVTAPPISIGSNSLITEYFSDREDLHAVLVPPDPNAGIVHLLEAQTERLDALVANTAHAADALAFRLEQAEDQNHALAEKLDAIEKNTRDAIGVLAVRLEQAEDQTKDVKDQFVSMRNLALLSLGVAIVGLVLTLVLTTMAN